MYTYLASPYSGSQLEQQQRYEAVETATALLLTERIAVYSPIVHNHYISIRHKLPSHAEFWTWYAQAMLTGCRVFAILTLPAWEKSIGVFYEYKLAKSLGKPVIFYNLEGDKVEQVKDAVVPGLVTRLHGLHEVL